VGVNYGVVIDALSCVYTTLSGAMNECVDVMQRAAMMMVKDEM
jgi:hypothetical protein